MKPGQYQFGRKFRKILIYIISATQLPFNAPDRILNVFL